MFSASMLGSGIRVQCARTRTQELSVKSIKSYNAFYLLRTLCQKKLYTTNVGGASDEQLDRLSVVQLGCLVLKTADPELKVKYTLIARKKISTQDELTSTWHESLPALQTVPVATATRMHNLGSMRNEPMPRIAVPSIPRLYDPKDMPPVRESTATLAQTILHNLAHIEFNAMNMYWDTALRFHTFVNDSTTATDTQEQCFVQNTSSEGKPPTRTASPTSNEERTRSTCQSCEDKDEPMIYTESFKPEAQEHIRNIKHNEIFAQRILTQSTKNSSLVNDKCVSEQGNEFMHDMITIAADEARHFAMVRKRLRELVPDVEQQNNPNTVRMQMDYGSLPAHIQLSTHLESTQSDLLGRLAVVPLVQEARGLDAGPRLVSKLMSVGDSASSRVVQQIVDEEKGHVAMGLKWFVRLCERSGISPQTEFQRLVREYIPTGIPCPVNHEARHASGLTEDWYAPLITVPKWQQQVPTEDTPAHVRKQKRKRNRAGKKSKGQAVVTV